MRGSREQRKNMSNNKNYLKTTVFKITADENV